MNDDKELLEGLSKGSWESYELLFIRYHPQLIAFIHGFTHNRELARDMAQDIFLSVWEKHNHMERIEFFSSYLFRIAKNMVSNHFKHLAVQRKFVDEVMRKSYVSSNDSEEPLFLHELNKMVEIQLRNIPKRRKFIFYMSRYEGLSNTEIASLLGVSKRTVENNISLVLSELKNKKFLLKC